ncbi:MAG: WbqC family protein, partial [Myxococcota bacterium]
LEGETGAGYLDVPLLGSFGMDVEFHAYEHPVYEQLHGPFVSHLSALDLLLCRGRAEAGRVLRGTR